MTRDEFIKEARSIHGNDYEYDKVPHTEIYTTNHIDVYCNKCKEYYRVKVWHHIRGKQKHSKCFTRPHALNTESFIAKAISVHGDKFGYDKVNYVDSVKTVTILCKACGEYYEQRPTFHLGGKGHGMCKFNNRGHDSEYFISKAVKVHGDKYGYDRVYYVNSTTPVEILCKKCNTYYLQKPSTHIAGSGHKPCTLFVNTKTTEQFIEEAINVHGDKYDYSKVDYVNAEKKVAIICKEHGEFLQTPHSHLKGFGCRSCGKISFINKVRTSHDDYISKAKEIHGDKYDYSKTKYTTTYNKIIVGCPVHGDFEVRADGHLKYGCARCGADAIMHTTESFIKRARELHGDKYDYSKSEYVHSTKPITIICKEHGEFTQVASEHIRSRAPGCGVCASSLGEKLLFDILKQNNIKFIKEYKLGGTNYRYDYYLTDLNILLEYDGIQHFKPIPFFGGEESFIYTKESDAFKNTLAETHNIPLIRISYWYISNLQDVLNNKLRMYVKYKRDGKYFKNFLEYAKHFGLDGDAKSIDHKQYLFKLV